MWLSLLKSRRIDINAPLVDTFRTVAKSTVGIGVPIAQWRIPR
uniref:Uncharacterized protein n=1 Tax=Escherichia coli TaxID=562 RepID=A0A891ZWF3_ECOLX|nr:hypothetical protein [Escherichia coli]